MTTLKAEMQADVAAVFQNTDEFAETWEHWPGGDSGSAVSATVIPNYPSESQGQAEERSTSRGLEQVRKFTIYVADSLTLTSEDAWQDEGGNEFQTLTIGESEEGLIPVVIQRNDKNHTSRPGQGQLL